MSKNTRNRILLTAVAALLLVTMAVGGTIAYLQATSGTVTNTFEPTEIEVLIQEHEIDEDGELTDVIAADNSNSYEILPGVPMNKDPFVNASSDVNYYVFVKVVETNWPTAMDGETRKVSYTIDSYWTELTSAQSTTTVDGKTVITKVYYKALNANIPVTNQAVIAGNQISVSEKLEESEMPTGNATLTFDAYAIQQKPFADVAAAWEALGN